MAVVGVLVALIATASCSKAATPSAATPTPFSSFIPSASPSSTAVSAPTPQPSGLSPSSAGSASATPGASAEPVRAADLITKAGFHELERRANGTIGLALVQLDSDGAQTDAVQVGSWQTGPAWSTIKVPLSMAALSEQDDSSTRSTVRRAITASDNAAALELWRDLGPSEVAGPRVQRQLALRGDTTTEVQQQITRSGFSAFGQTRWSLEDQATFAAQLVCSPSPSAVLQDMQRITPSQRWGLGQIRSAAIKGGWGPLNSGPGYTARQLGVLQSEDGSTWGVAISSENTSGFQAAVQDLNRISEWLTQRFDDQDLSLNTTKLHTRTCS